jgi:hypothetical protein
MVHQTHEMHIDERHLGDLKRVLWRRIRSWQNGDIVARSNEFQHVGPTAVQHRFNNVRLTFMFARDVERIDMARDTSGIVDTLSMPCVHQSVLCAQ